MKKLIALLLALIMAISAMAFAEDEIAGEQISEEVSEEVNEEAGEETGEEAGEAETDVDLEHLTVGNVTAMRGEFFTEMWGNSTSDSDVRALLHGYDLFYWNGEAGAFEPDPTVVAEIEYRSDAEGNKSYVISLQNDLYWSDGTRITAWDYAFSYLLGVSPEIEKLGGKPYRREKLLGYEDYVSGKTEYLAGVSVLDSHRLYLTLDHRFLPFFYELGLLMCKPYPISVIAPGVEVRDDGEGVYLANIDDRNNKPVFTAELLKKTILDPKTGYMSHPSLTCGPYKLLSWDGTTAEFELNTKFKGDYKGKKPIIKYLTYTLADNDTMIDKLANGEFGLLNKAMRTDVVQAGMQLTGEGVMSMRAYPRSGLSFISFACEKPTVADKAVRQAIAWCLDRDKVMTEYTGANGLTVDGYYGIVQWMYRIVSGTEQPPVKEPEDSKDTKAVKEYEAELAEWEELSLDKLVHYSVDLNKARSLLEKDGWKLNNEGIREKKIAGKVVKLELKLIYPEGNRIGEIFKETFVNNLKSVGIKLEMEAVPMQQLLSRFYKQEDRDFDMVYLASNFDIVFDPSENFIVDEKGNPNWAYTNDTDKELYRRAFDMSHTEPGEALEYCKKWISFQERFNDTLPMLPIYANVYFDFSTPLLKEYYIEENVTWGQAIIGAYLSEEEP